MKNQTGPPGVKVHAVEVHDEHGNHLRTHLQPGGKYWPVGGEPHHPAQSCQSRQATTTRGFGRAAFSRCRAVFF